MKNKFLLIIISLLTLSACKHADEICIVDNQLNKWSYKDRFKIQLPVGYYFSSSIIYNSDSIKVGEIVLDYEKLETKMSGQDFIMISSQNGEIITEETSYSSDCYDCTFIKADSLLTRDRKWYFTIEQMDYEGPDNDYGTWTAFHFVNVENNKILLLTFYNKDLANLQIDKYKRILESIEY